MLATDEWKARTVAARILARLGRINPTAIFLATAALVLGSLVFGGPVGALVLIALDAGLVFLLVRLWPGLDSRARMARVTLLVAFAALAVAQLLR